MGRALSSLMPNLRRARRRLYLNTLLSIVMYVAPVWSEKLSSSARKRATLSEALRLPIQRTIVACRTVSLEAAFLLARIPPLYITTDLFRRIYEFSAELKLRGEFDYNAVKEFSVKAGIRHLWLAHVRREGLPGTRIRDAIVQHFDEWVERRIGFLTFRLMQLLTGHGCFGIWNGTCSE